MKSCQISLAILEYVFSNVNCVFNSGVCSKLQIGHDGHMETFWDLEIELYSCCFSFTEESLNVSIM